MTEQDVVLQAVFVCRNEEFHRYVERKQFYVWGTCDEQHARNYLREICGIKTRGDLRHDLKARERFHQLVADFRSDVARRAD